MKFSRTLGAAAAAVAVLASSGCAPLLVGGAVAGGAMVAVDRRSPGIQLEDQSIELRLMQQLGAKFPGDKGHISATSYNRRVLLTGEVADEQGKAEAQSTAEKSESVVAVMNELVIGAPSSLANRNFDTALTSKVLAALLQAKDVPSGTIKVVSERAVVYLMGRVTQAEGEASARAASRVSGVRQVVKYFDYLTEQEAAKFASTPPAETPPK
jgi:osmotically-inducible protein OsmY